MNQILLYKLLFFACISAEVVFTPLFLMAGKEKPCIKSLTFKTICASLYIITGIIAIKLSGNTDSFAKMLMLGLIMSWFGDFFLHISAIPCQVIGGLSFFSAHIFYIIAYFYQLSASFPGSDFFTAYELIAFVFIIGVIITITEVKHVNFGKAFFACFLYMCAITAMTVKAFSLSVRLVFSKSIIAVKDPVAAAIVLSLGSLLFLLSDFSIAFLMFGGQKKNYKLKKFNIWTYFIGQLLLSMSIYFLGNP